ncbi:FxSxx-COOH system tetratricopeptide repeat protein [Streptomyces sp. NBC_00670]|uniref:FxSxx-COOH system tetratricopeptide repeat protein n=1 Tax=Streptomyces sp. NBC_00670 TaxID=2975804 RepID=UPI002E381303|nr:FxSxx-COOH system tetratricopeptide repeat protein [Streptomyces sp. NBC_00670]
MTGDEGRIITFYSYKGGTGRTMALANTAWILASAGHRVLAVDWDLDAPGLDRFFHPFLDEEKLRTTPGVLELVSRFSESLVQVRHTGAVAPGSGHDPVEAVAVPGAARYAEMLPLDSCVLPVSWHFPDGGWLDYLPAGTKNKGYLTAFSQFDWKPFMDGPLATRFLERLKREFGDRYDYVLIDSRTGLNDISDICTVNLPHTLVTCFTPSSQSIDGAVAVATRIEEMHRDRRIRILPVPMRVENAEADRLEAARGQFQYRFDRILRRHLAPGTEPDDYWGRVEIPYRPIYSYEETLAPFREAPGDPKSLLAAYERLAEVLSDGQVRRMARIDETLRRRTLERYTRHRPPRVTDVYVSFVPQDRSWALWAGAVLEEAGFKVHLAQEGTAEGGRHRQEIERVVESAPHTLVVLSEAYLRSSRFRTTWEAVYAAGGLTEDRRLVSLCVERLPLGSPFTDRLADLTRCDTGEAARDTLLACFGRSFAPAAREHYTGGERRMPRYPGAEPPVWSVPLRTASFTGRTALLEQIRERLCDGDGRALLLKGLGGVGKTLLAREFAHRYKSDYDIAWHIQAEQRNLAVEQFAAMAGPLGVAERKNPTDTAKAVREALDRGEPYGSWLLILDNAVEAGNLPDFMVTGRSGHVLITSQRSEGWGRWADTLEVGVFEREESIAHLRGRLPDCGRADADQIAEVLGDLPIAVEQAAAGIEQSKVSARAYIRELQSPATGAARTRGSGDDKVGDVTRVSGATWEFALGQLRRKFPQAVQLLQICAYFGPEPISMDLLEGAEVSRALGDSRTVARAYQELSRFSLVTVDRKIWGVQVHRLVQRAMRDSMTEQERQAARDVVYRTLIAARPSKDDPEDPNTWESYRVIWSHLGAPWAMSAHEGGIRELLVDRVRQLRRRGELTQAMDLGVRCVTTWTESGPADDRWTLHMRFQIANILRAQGRYEESLALDEEVRERQLATLRDPDDQHVLMTTSSIAADLRGLGRLAEALDHDRRTHQRYLEIYGEDHPRTLGAANNLAVSLRLSGEYYQARALDTRTLELREEILLHDHPLTIESAVNLGRDLRDCGDYAASAALLRRAYDRCLQNPRLTPGSPTVLNTAKGLAGALRRTGRPAEAQELVEHVLKHGQDGEKGASPERLLVEMSLAGDLAAQGRRDEGLRLIRRVLGDLRDSLGEDHPQTVACSANYAVMLLGDIGTGPDPASAGDTGTVEEAARARALLQRALEGFTALNGEHHPYTLVCRVNLAAADAALGDREEARKGCQEAYDLLREALEPTHPSTLTCAADLGLILGLLGRPQEARSTLQAALTALAKRLGEDHPRVRSLREERITCLELEPSPI